MNSVLGLRQACTKYGLPTETFNVTRKPLNLSLSAMFVYYKPFEQGKNMTFVKLEDSNKLFFGPP